MAAINWSPFADLVQQHQRFVLTSHVRPDCDALGSELGMAAVLASLGKDARIVNADATPPTLTFIDAEQSIGVLHHGVTSREVEQAEVLIVLDTSAWNQLGTMADVLRATRLRKVVVDHHVSEDDLGAESFKDVEAEATGRLVVEAADHLQVRLTPRMATPLFAAMATDTGWFRYTSTTALSYRVAARLIEAGADPAAIYRELYERDTMGRLRLRGMALQRITIERGGRLAYTYLQAADFAACGALPTDTEDLVNMALAVDGVEVALIFIEQPAGGFKVSFRSRSQVDCSRLAASFGGGGHKAAAGATVQGEWEKVRTTVLDAAGAAMR